MELLNLISNLLKVEQTEQLRRELNGKPDPEDFFLRAEVDRPIPEGVRFPWGWLAWLDPKEENAGSPACSWRFFSFWPFPYEYQRRNEEKPCSPLSAGDSL